MIVNECHYINLRSIKCLGDDNNHWTSVIRVKWNYISTWWSTFWLLTHKFYIISIVVTPCIVRKITIHLQIVRLVDNTNRLYYSTYSTWYVTQLIRNRLGITLFMQVSIMSYIQYKNVSFCTIKATTNSNRWYWEAK